MRETERDWKGLCGKKKRLCVGRDGGAAGRGRAGIGYVL